MLKIKINPSKQTFKESIEKNPLCNKISSSNGFILPNGEYIPGNGKSHEEIAFELIKKFPEFEDVLDSVGNGIITNELVYKKGLVRVSNAFGYEINSEKITWEQKKKIIEIINSCKNNSKNLLDIYDVIKRKPYVFMKAAFAEPKQISTGFIDLELLESISKKFKKFLSK